MERMENRFSWLPNPKQKNKKKIGDYWGTNIFVTHLRQHLHPRLRVHPVRHRH